MANNIPRVSGKNNQQRFFDRVKEALDTMMGKNQNALLDQVITIKDLERLKINGEAVDPDRFLKATKSDPYSL